MADVYDLEVVVSAIDRMSSIMETMEKALTHFQKAAASTESLEEMGKHMMVAGAAAAGLGVAMAYGLSEGVDAAVDMQAEMAHLQTAMDDGAATMQHLNEVQEEVESLSSRSAIGAVELAQAYYMARSNMMSHVEALKAVAAANDLVIGTTRDAAEANREMEPTARTLSTMVLNFGGSMSVYADMLAKLQSKYAFRGISEITYALEYAMPAAKGAGVSVKEMTAALALLSAGGLHGAEAGTAFQAMVSKFASDTKLRPFLRETAEGGVDLAGTMEAMKSAFGGLTPVYRALALHQMGFGDAEIRGLQIMMDKVGMLKGVEEDLDRSRGAAHALAMTRGGALDEKTAALANSWERVKVMIGEELMPVLTRMADVFGRVLDAVGGFIKAHPEIAKYAITFVAIGAAGLVVVGAMAAVAGTMAFVTGAFGAATVGATLFWSAALLGIPLLVAGIAAAAAYVYDHWEPVRAYFVGLWREVVDEAERAWTAIRGYAGAVAGFFESVWAAIRPANLFGKLVPEFFDWGARLMRTFALGIVAPIADVVHGVEWVGKRIMEYLPHRSPADVGPLSTLDRLPFSETFAESIRPEPAMAAANVLARSTAVPLASAGNYYAKIIALHHDTIAGLPVRGNLPAGGSSVESRSVVINLHYAPVIHAGAGVAISDLELEKHADEMLTIVRERMERERRRQFI